VTDDLPRGIRNNNPGNIIWLQSNHWRGQTGSDGTFCIFDTAINGIRAATIILRHYKGNTIRSIISRWSATDQAAYIKNVSDHLKTKPDDYIDPSNVWTMLGIVEAIIVQENGKIYYDPTTIRAGVDMGMTSA
jgi:hypothetical protein